MRRIRVRERTATSEELADDRRRIRAAREQHRLLAAPGTIAYLRHGLDETQDMPAITMADLIEAGAA